MKAGRALALATLLMGCAAPADNVWRPFSEDSPWNMPIPATADIDPNSEALMADLGAGGRLYINIQDWSVPVYYVDSDVVQGVAVTNSRPGIYGVGFAPGEPIPIPEGAVASPPAGGDNHLAIIDRAKGLEWGMWWARQDDMGAWSTGLGAVTDLTGTGVAPPWNAVAREFDAHRARASGFPLIAGLIRPEEIAAGRIDHALVFATTQVRTEYFIPPASTAQAQTGFTRDSLNGLPMGARIQLDPALDVDALDLSAPAKIIARALQEYGAYLGDYAGANVIYLDNSPEAQAAWTGVLDNEDLSAVFTEAFIAKHMRLIDMGVVREGQNIGVRPD